MKKKIKKIIFLTGTRADFGKIKSLIIRLKKDKGFNVTIFVTGMHMLEKYGNTFIEVDEAIKKNIFKFVNQNYLDGMETVVAKTILGLSDYLNQNKPELLIIYGDRVETLAAAIVGALNNIPVAHFEGGEISGTVDEKIRHAVTKLSDFHFVSNKDAFRRVHQLGENKKNIFNVGSPDVDFIKSKLLPSFKSVRKRYDIKFNNYGILLFHPVTSELEDLSEQVSIITEALILSKKNYIVIYPNNDRGVDRIIDQYNKKFQNNPKFRILPSMKFEYFLTTLKNASFIIGNSSAGIREAPYFGTHCVNLGSRQKNRTVNKLIIHVNFNISKILTILKKIHTFKKYKKKLFGSGRSNKIFHRILSTKKHIWTSSTQKYFEEFKKK
jgi:UDP-N-acetylglucosamine 2-epimerase (hydrolysing)